MKQNKSVIVTGGAGFIGSHVVDTLIDKGQRVRVIDNLVNGNLINLQKHKNQSRLDFIQHDISTLNSNSNVYKGVSSIYHLAGIGDIVPSIERPYDYFYNNVNGTIAILEGCRLNKIESLVYAASSSCYGIANIPTDESHPIDPQYPYALTKYLGEQSVFHWGKVYGIRTNSICIFNAYGPRARTSGAYGAVFGVFLKQRLEGSPLTIVGDGEQKRDFVYVTDVADAFVRANDVKISGHRFNIGGGNPISINTLAQLIGGKQVMIPSRPGEPLITHANISKAQQLLGWSPTIDFKTGVSKMLEQIQSWKDAPLWTSESISHATRLWFKYLGKNEI